jgi:hypothetical protein
MLLLNDDRALANLCEYTMEVSFSIILYRVLDGYSCVCCDAIERPRVRVSEEQSRHVGMPTHSTCSYCFWKERRTDRHSKWTCLDT